MEIIVEAPGRVHIALLAMDEPIYRINGGIGFSIDCLNVRVRVRPSRRFRIYDRRSLPLDAGEIARLVGKLDEARRCYSIEAESEIEILSGPPPHVGLGSGTSTTLAVIEGYLELWGIQASQAEIIRLSLRGGTSGIGVRSYFEGGFVFDVGQRYLGQSHMPSRQNEGGKERALPLMRADMPPWNVGLFLPEGFYSTYGDDERAFFQNVCPITHSEAAATTYHAVFGAAGSVVGDDYASFRKSIASLQQLKWKSSEISRYGKRMYELIKAFEEVEIVAGMSSLGPAVYLLPPDPTKPISSDIESMVNGRLLEVTLNNYGRKISRA